MGFYHGLHGAWLASPAALAELSAETSRRPGVGWPVTNAVALARSATCDRASSVLQRAGAEVRNWYPYTRITMLLCLVNRFADNNLCGFKWHCWSSSGCGNGIQCVAAGCGQDRDGPLRVGGQALMRSQFSAGKNGPGDGRQIVRRPAGRGSRLEGQAVPGATGCQSAAARRWG
jgi:hypothetical protein